MGHYTPLNVFKPMTNTLISPIYMITAWPDTTQFIYRVLWKASDEVEILLKNLVTKYNPIGQQVIPKGALATKNYLFKNPLILMESIIIPDRKIMIP